MTAPTFPHIGAFALLIDKSLPPSQQRAELVRVLGFAIADDRQVRVIFPLRRGTATVTTVAAADLIDGTALDCYEKRELADLDAALRGNPAPTIQHLDQAARRDLLKARATWSIRLQQLLRQASLERVAA